EITAAQYESCVVLGGCPAQETVSSEVDNYGAAGREEHPINGVSWFDAATYCAWASGRLPTEWEWEWAARGRDEGWTYPWGNAPAPSCAVAVMSDNAGG